MNLNPTRIIEKNKKWGSHNAVLAFCVAMAIFGIIMIFDASGYIANRDFGDQYYFFYRQIIYVVGSLIPAYIIYKWDYRKLSKLATPALFIGIILLVLVLIDGVGVVKNGSRRWISLGFMDLQPAEFIKPLFIIYISAWLAKERATYHHWKDALKLGFGKKLAGFATVLGTILLLIVLEPDLGTTMIIGITAFAIFFISSSDIIHTIGSFVIVGVFGVLALIAGLIAPYRFERIRTFVALMTKGEVQDPLNSGQQIYQILIGIGSAGWLGKGFGQSRQRFGYLVENTAFTDSIFAVLLEELGWLGGFTFVAAWIVFFIAGIRISSRAPDKQGQLMAFGLTLWLTMQAFLNMSANVGMIPLTGIPLPFLTYGGSNTLVTVCSMALLLNIARVSQAGPSTKSDRIKRKGKKFFKFK